MLLTFSTLVSVFVCVRLCVCERGEREKERKRERSEDRHRQTKKEGVHLVLPSSCSTEEIE